MVLVVEGRNCPACKAMIPETKTRGLQFSSHCLGLAGLGLEEW